MPMISASSDALRCKPGMKLMMKRIRQLPEKEYENPATESAIPKLEMHPAFEERSHTQLIGQLNIVMIQPPARNHSVAVEVSL